MLICVYADPMFRGIYHGSAKHRGLLLLDAMFNTELVISAYLQFKIQFKTLIQFNII